MTFALYNLQIWSDLTNVNVYNFSQKQQQKNFKTYLSRTPNNQIQNILNLIYS